MAERATLNQTTQLGVEAVAGTPVAANKLLQAISITPGIEATIQKFRSKGSKFITAAALGKEWTGAKIEANVVCYNHLAYLFSGLLAYSAPAQQGATTAYKQTFTPAMTAADTIKTYTLEQGSAARAGRFAYGLVNSVNLKGNREEISCDGEMIGQAYEDGVAMTAGPTAIPIQPILPGTVDIWIDSAAAGLGTTKLLRNFAYEFTFGNRFSPIWPVNSAVDGFDGHVEVEPEWGLKLLVAADAQGMGNLTAMRAGTKQFLRWKAVGPLIADIYYHTLQIDACFIVSEKPSEFKDENGVYAIEWTLEPCYDAAWAKALTVELTNTIVSL